MDIGHNNIDKEKERDRIDWRRSKVQELSSQGHSQRDSTNPESIKQYHKQRSLHSKTSSKR